MRPEERYWLKVTTTISAVVLVLLLFLIVGLAKGFNHIFDSLLKLVE